MSPRRLLGVLTLGVVGVATLIVATIGDDRPTSSLPPAVDGAEWEVAFQDTFDDAELDTDRWTTCYWWDDGGCTNLGNDEAQWYLPAQTTVTDGALALTAEPQTSRHLDKDFTHTSGMVTTGRVGDPGEDDPRFAFTYGYVEVRFRTPTGSGLWPAVWMLPTTNESLPEIDLLEQYGDDTSEASTTMHTDDGGERRVDRSYADTADLSQGWHTVAIDWQEDRLRWFIDDQEVYRIDGDRVPDEEMYLLLNLAVGGPAGDPPAETAFPATFLIDEVTVWTRR